MNWDGKTSPFLKDLKRRRGVSVNNILFGQYCFLVTQKLNFVLISGIIFQIFKTYSVNLRSEIFFKKIKQKFRKINKKSEKQKIALVFC
ncbi:hypothetical protein [Methanolapillus ohkumae]|uniref:hypothetical protein n=1 Tax=Methanolapillus ohkumae TaxID=3028298 RepID=UPI0030B8FAFC